MNITLINKSLKAAGLSLAALMLLIACKTLITDKTVAAVITNPSTETKAELVATLALIFNGRQIKLADDALTNTDTLIITRKIQRSLEHDPVMGRSFDNPYRFNLVKIGKKCFLIDQQKDKHYPLNKIKCVIRK